MHTLFEQIAQQTPAGLMVADADRVIRFANRAAETSLGYAPGELDGVGLERLIPEWAGGLPPVPGTPGDPREPMDLDRGPIARHKDGREISVEIGLTPLHDLTGTYTLVSITDVTEQRTMERQFRVLAESLPLMVWTCRGDGPCDYLSPQWAAYTGMPAEDQLGYGWLERLHPDDQAPTRASWATAAASGGVFDTEFRIQGGDGIYRWFKTRATPIRAADDTITKWIGSNTEIQTLVDAREATLRANQALEARVLERTAELRATNEQLSTTTAQLTNAQRITRVGSWELDVPTGSVRWSDELFRIMGMEPGEAPGYQHQAGLFTPASWARLTAAIAHSVETGEGYELTLDMTATDGARLTTIARAETTRDHTGAIVQLVGTLQDITERERASAQLRQLNERLQLATSAARMGVWDWDVATNVLVWDDAMKRLYGLAADHAVGAYDAWSSALHPEDRAQTEQALSDAFAGTAEFNSIFRIVRPDGEVRHLRAAARLDRDPVTGAPVRMIGVNWDVTTQRLAELALQRSEAVQRAIVASAGAAVIATDLAGTITLFNRYAEDLLGFRAPDVVERGSLVTLHAPEEVEARRLVLERELGVSITSPFEVLVVKARAQGADANEWTYVRADGSRLSVLVAMTTIRDHAGAITGFLGVATDLTLRKRAERELVELNHLLADRSKQREVLLQEVHHRVKNNLQVIASLVSMQLRQLHDAAARRALQETQMRIQAIAQIHEQLYQEENYANIEFSDYARSLASRVFQTSGISAAVSLDLAFEAVTLAVDKAIPCGLILNELIVNASKHAFPGDRRGTIRVALQAAPPHHVALTVADDGCGMPEQRPAAHASSLGMRLVATLAHQLTGTVEVDSAPARGTTVRVVFPVRDEPRPESK